MAVNRVVSNHNDPLMDELHARRSMSFEKHYCATKEESVVSKRESFEDIFDTLVDK